VLTNAAREGARLAVLEGPTDGEVRTRVNDYLTGGGLTALADGNIQVNRTFPIGTSTASRIEVDYPFSFMVLNPVVRMVSASSTAGQPITMGAVSIMRNE
jgi:hypothetical protein